MAEPTHRSYLLRLWRERDHDPWRVTLIPTAQPDTHQHFETLAACYAFVEAQAISTTDMDGRLLMEAPNTR